MSLTWEKAHALYCLERSAQYGTEDPTDHLDALENP